MCCFLYIKDDFLIDINIEEYFMIDININIEEYFVIVITTDLDSFVGIDIE
jgi:hypothetical protein